MEQASISKKVKFITDLDSAQGPSRPASDGALLPGRPGQGVEEGKTAQRT